MLAKQENEMLNLDDIPIFIANSSKITPKPMCRGITRRTLSTGNKIMFCLFEWGKNAILPEYSHPMNIYKYKLAK